LFYPDGTTEGNVGDVRQRIWMSGESELAVLGNRSTTSDGEGSRSSMDSMPGPGFGEGGLSV